MRVATDEFRQWFQNALALQLMPVDRQIIKRGSEVTPKLLVFDHQHRLTVVPILDFANSADKDHLVALQQSIGARVDLVLAAVLVNECWMVKGANAKEAYRMAPSKHPKRIEVMVYNAIRGDMQLLAHCEINRADQSLGAPEIVDTAGWAAGRMVLGDNRPRH